MTSSMPILDLLETTHTFPCPYLFKLIGKQNDALVARVVAIVREELAIECDPPYRIRATAGGRHQSVTLEPVVQTAQQVLAIYRRLKDVDGVIMLF